MTQVDPTKSKSISAPPTYNAQKVKEAIADGKEEIPKLM